MPKHRWMTEIQSRILPVAPLPRPVQPPSAPALAELEEESLAPTFGLESLHGLTVTLDDLRRAGQPVVLIFTRPTCPACDTLLPDIGRWQRELVDRLVVMPVSKGGVEANREKALAHNLVDVLLQSEDEVSTAYGVQILPSGVLVRDGRIAQRYAEGPEAIRALVASAASAASPAAPS
jgi:peroxiredoxin